jgi:hypothetical protein
MTLSDMSRTSASERVVFGEPIGSGALGIIGRLLAFGLVIAGGALVPAPLRARPDPT